MSLSEIDFDFWGGGRGGEGLNLDPLFQIGLMADISSKKQLSKNELS